MIQRILTAGLLAALLPAWLGLSVPAAAAPHLVADLNTGPNVDTQTLTVWTVDAGQSVLSFGGSDPDHGLELWQSDGRPEGTRRLADVCAGRCGSNPGQAVTFRGRLYFTADDGFAGRELWVSDGTPGSERRVRDLCPGPCGSDPGGLTVLGDRLFFFATTAGRRQLWSTNGSRRGTVMVRDVCAPSPSSGCGDDLQRVGGTLFFTAYNGDSQLWRSDGTAAGTVPLRRLLAPGVSLVGAETPHDLDGSGDGGVALFWAADGLWRTDGTGPGTFRIARTADLVTDPAGFNVPFRIRVWNGALYTVLGEGEMIRSDGTAAGTTRIAEFASGYDVNDLTPTDGALLFRVDRYDGARFTNDLWRTEGTPETTVRYQSFEGEGFITSMVALTGDRAVFRRTVPHAAGASTVELWTTDGTAAGTRLLLADTGPYDLGLARAGEQAFFVRGGYYLRQDLWRTDGTEAGTYSVRDFGAGPGSGAPLAQAVLGGRLVFSARTALLEAPLFTSDGTAAGTRLLSAEGSWAMGFTRVRGRLFFPSATATEGEEAPSLYSNGLWWTDGTRAVQASPSIAGYQSPAALGGLLLFGAQREAGLGGSSDNELWRSDGTGPGTVLVRDIDPFIRPTGFHHACVGESSLPGPGVEVGGRLLFAADDGRHGRELFATDGTAAGTRLVRDINPAPLLLPEDDDCNGVRQSGEPSSPADLTAFRGGVLFTADDGKSGRELWWSNGTTAGTRRVRDLRPGPAGSMPHDLAVLGGAAFFIASSQAAGEALWRTDGTAAGTVLVDDLTVGGTPSWARGLTAAGGKLFFSVYNEATGAELWVSRGTAASTGLVADLRPGGPSSAPQALTAVGDALVFAADDGVHGAEPWASDGTAAGTRLLGDIHPGRDASSPGPFSVVGGTGGTVLTGAGDGEHGRELWAIPVADLK